MSASRPALRAPRHGDHPALAGLAAHRYLTLGLDHERDARDAVRDPPWAPGGLDGDVRIVLIDDAVAGFVWLREVQPLLRRDGRAGFLEVWVDPAHRGRGAGALLLDSSIDRGRVFTELRSVVGRDSATDELLSSRGFALHHTDLLMEVSVTGAEDPSSVPGFFIRDDLRGDEVVAAMMTADQGSFADREDFVTAPRSFFQEVAARSDFRPDLALFAFSDTGALAGFCVSSFLDDRPEPLGVIEDIGTLPPFRRRGVARALLRASIGRLARLGTRTVRLDTGADNTAARSLYTTERFVVTHERRTWVRELPTG